MSLRFSVLPALGAAIVLAGISFAYAARGSAHPAPAQAAAAQAQVPGAGKAAELPSAVQIEPDALAKMLADREKPVVLHVGFKNFYDQAHIPGSEYVGPDSRPEGLEALRKRVEVLPRKQLIVLYCGCCPWDKCPNDKPAYEALHAMGFTNVKVVHMAENFGANWANAGLPTTKAQ